MPLLAKTPISPCHNTIPLIAVHPQLWPSHVPKHYSPPWQYISTVCKPRAITIPLLKDTPKSPQATCHNTVSFLQYIPTRAQATRQHTISLLAVHPQQCASHMPYHCPPSCSTSTTMRKARAITPSPTLQYSPKEWSGQVPYHCPHLLLRPQQCAGHLPKNHPPLTGQAPPCSAHVPNQHPPHRSTAQTAPNARAKTPPLLQYIPNRAHA